jgi:hypothetical protein
VPLEFFTRADSPARVGDVTDCVNADEPLRADLTKLSRFFKPLSSFAGVFPA